MKQVYDICSFLEGERFRLGIAGFYPSRIKRTLLVNLVTIFVYLITFGQMAVVIAFVAHTTELSKISEIFLFSMTQVAFINKVINFHLKGKNMAVLEGMISDKMFTRVTENELLILKSSFKRCQRIVNVFLICCIAVVVLYGVFPLMDSIGSGEKNYPLPGRFPFNPDDYYIIIYSAEVLTVAVSAWNNGGIDTLFTKYAAIATAFFTILGEKLKNVLDNVEDSDDRIVEKRIKHCVIYYNKIACYVSLIEQTFSYGFLIQFICSAVVFCLTCFQLMLVVSFQSAQFGLLAIYFICMVCQLVLYCWHGHLLMEKSDAITRACYEINWNEMSVKNQKMLLVIMERAKRPVTLHAAGVFELNLSTLMTLYNICKHFKTEKQYLGLAGFYPGTFPNYKIAIQIFSIFIVFIETFQLGSTIAFVVAHTSDVIKLSETLLFSMTQLAFLSKLFNFIIKKKNCHQIEIMLSNKLFAELNNEEEQIFKENIKAVHLIAKIYRILCINVVLLYGVFPFIDSSKEGKIYALPCLFPFNPDNYYVTVVLGEVLSIALGAWVNSTIDMFFCVLVTIGQSQFEILGNRIRNITKNTTNTRSDLVERRLVDCVMYYHDLLRYIDMIENTFSGGIFVQFTCSVAVICLTGFQMLVIEIQSIQFILLITYFSCMMCQVVVYCWYGQLIMEKSDGLTKACYEVEWHKTNVKVQRMLFTIMERAKKPAVIKAAGFFNLNLATLMTILRSSYSYFAVLQRLYSKNN